MAVIDAPAQAAEQDEWPYEYDVLDIHDLIVDPAYQRDLKPQQLKRMVSHFKPSLLGTITVNVRKKGDIALIDGQHRVATLAQIGRSRIAACVFEGLTRAQEAELFSDLQNERRNTTSVEKFNARLVFDRQAKEIRRIAEETGWEIGNTGLRCIAELDKLYARDKDGTILYRTLRASRRAWPAANAKEAAHGSIISGLGRFVAEQDPDDERLITRLGRTSPIDVLARADDLRRGKGSGSASIYVTEVVAGIYLRRA